MMYNAKKKKQTGQDLFHLAPMPWSFLRGIVVIQMLSLNSVEICLMQPLNLVSLAESFELFQLSIAKLLTNLYTMLLLDLFHFKNKIFLKSKVIAKYI